jgi:DNA modification methylase
LRVDKAKELTKDGNWIIWHDLESERKAISESIECTSVYGSQPHSTKERLLNEFKHGKYRVLATKPSIAGSGCNFQHNCNQALFLGISYKFKDFIQAVHRIVRFGQKKEVDIHILYHETESEILKTLLSKWNKHKEMADKMSAKLKKYGLTNREAIEVIKRATTVKRQVYQGKNCTIINNDTVLECANIKDNSVDLILTSIPFSDHYEYCESYLDFGHNNGNKGFFDQMDYLTPELLRILEPGRVACIHVKNRIIFSYQNGVGFSTEDDFRAAVSLHFLKHGFHKLGEHIITTDVVRENNQTYRLGHTENCKDATKMGAGLPEYLLVFRKPPTDQSTAYADTPVTKTKTGYGLGRWQLDAHAYWRSDGDRLLTPDELDAMPTAEIREWWVNRGGRYSYKEHVEMVDYLASKNKLPKTFMAYPPISNTDAVWDNVNRMHTLNSNQMRKRQEKHVCPLQFDIIDRCIDRYSNVGDLVFDPFGGIMSTPYRALLKDRKAIATELNPQYWENGVIYCKEAEYKMNNVPTLFGTFDQEVVN